MAQRKSTENNTTLSRSQREQVARGTKVVAKAPEKVPKIKTEDSQSPQESLIITMKLVNLPSINTNDLMQVANRTQEYFSICVESNTRPTVASFALALGTNRQTLLHWVNDKNTKPENVRGFLQKYFAVFEALTETSLVEGQSYPLSTMFLAKNNLGYTDKKEINIVAPDIQPTVEDMKAELNLLKETRPVPPETDD